MIEKHFMFADFVEEFWVPFVTYVQEKGHYATGGKWVEGAFVPMNTGGIILPLTSDDLKYEANGRYTELDRKIYTVEPLAIKQKIEYEGQKFTIDSEKPYQAYADVFIYFAKGVSI